MKKTSKLILGAMIACTILAPCQFVIPSLQLNAKAGELENYQRKYVSFFQNQITPLNNVILNVIQTELPRFDYHLLGSAFNLDIMSFLSEVKQYQKDHAGELASKNEQENIKFKDKVLNWSETKLIMDSAYVFGPVWSFTPIEITKAQKIKKDKETYFAVYARSNLSLNLSIYKYQQDIPVKYSEINNDWSLSKEIRVDVNDNMTDKQKEQIILANNEVKIALSSTAENYFIATAQDTVNSSSAFVIKKIKQLSDFVLKGSIAEVDMKKDIAAINFGEKETPKTLGVKLDDGYKIIEYKTVGGTEQKVEVGFSKVRQIRNNDVVTQPLIVGRDYETGDQTIEYPKVGFNVLLKGGTTSFVFDNTNNMFTPHAYLDFEYNVGKNFGISELYSTLGLGANLTPVSYSGQNIITADADIGVVKKIYMRQLVLNLGGKISAIGADLKYQDEDYMNIAYGLTPMVGVSYLATPDIIVGFDLGYKYTLPSGTEWKKIGTDKKYTGPSIGSNGPVINLFFNYSL